MAVMLGSQHVRHSVSCVVSRVRSLLIRPLQLTNGPSVSGKCGRCSNSTRSVYFIGSIEHTYGVFMAMTTMFALKMVKRGCVLWFGISITG